MPLREGHRWGATDGVGKAFALTSNFNRQLPTANRLPSVLPQVASLLESSEVWGTYRHQRHDLFLPAGAAPGGSVAGLLKVRLQGVTSWSYTTSSSRPGRHLEGVSRAAQGEGTGGYFQG